ILLLGCHKRPQLVTLESAARQVPHVLVQVHLAGPAHVLHKAKDRRIGSTGQTGGRPNRVALTEGCRDQLAALAVQSLHECQYAEAAKRLDFEVTQVGPGCLNLRLICTADIAAGASYPLFQNGLMEQAATTLLENIEAEGQGVLRNAMVRTFLASMPGGVHRQ